MNVEEQITLVLIEHFFHSIEFTGATSGKWAIQCNCDAIVTANSHPEAEGSFAKHQAEAINTLMEAGK